METLGKYDILQWKLKLLDKVESKWTKHKDKENGIKSQIIGLEVPASSSCQRHIVGDDLDILLLLVLDEGVDWSQ